MSTSTARKHKVSVFFDDQEFATVSALASRYHLSASQTLRLLVMGALDAPKPSEIAQPMDDDTPRKELAGMKPRIVDEFVNDYFAGGYHSERAFYSELGPKQKAVVQAAIAAARKAGRTFEDGRTSANLGTVVLPQGGAAVSQDGDLDLSDWEE